MRKTGPERVAYVTAMCWVPLSLSSARSPKSDVVSIIFLDFATFMLVIHHQRAHQKDLVDW